MTTTPRLVEGPRCLASIAKEDLGRHAIFWKAQEAWEAQSLLEIASQLLPGFLPFVDHPAYASGSFVCRIGESSEPSYSANRHDLLRYHSDMSLHAAPPAVTLIRCIVPDSGPPPRDGALRLLHVEDACMRLRLLGRSDLLGLLGGVHTVRLADGSQANRAFIPAQLGEAPLTIFDRIGLQLFDAEAALLDDFLALCESFEDLCVRVAPQAGSVVAFSNRHFIHSRAPCTSDQRVTEICLGNFPTR